MYMLPKLSFKSLSRHTGLAMGNDSGVLQQWIQHEAGRSLAVTFTAAGYVPTACHISVKGPRPMLAPYARFSCKHVHAMPQFKSGPLHHMRPLT